MHKRKKLGIIKYGDRPKKAVKKLQAGGIVSQPEGYDWRDDPYEKQLTQERLAKQKQAATNARKTNAGSKKFNDTFSALTGGLEGSRGAAQTAFTNKQNEYLAQVKKNGVDWASDPAGIQAYQGVLNFGNELQQRITSEKVSFDKYSEEVKDSRETLAISGDSMFAAVYKKSGMGKDGKPTYTMNYQDVSLDDYNANASLGNDDKNKLHIQPQTIGQFMSWKSKSDRSGNVANITKYLQNGAESMDTFYQDNAEKLLKSAKLTIDTKHKLLNGEGFDGQSLEALQNGIHDILNGGDGSGDVSVSTSVSTNRSQIMGVVNDIYSRVTSNGYGDAKAMASLKAEVYSDSETAPRIKLIADKYTDPKEKKKAVDKYVADRMKVALVNRLLYAEKSKSKSTAGATGDPKTKSNADEQTSAFIDMALTGQGTKGFRFDTDIGDGTGRKNSYHAIGKYDYIRQSALNPSVETGFTVSKNEEFNKVVDTQHMYLADGSEVTGDGSVFDQMIADGVDPRSRMVLANDKPVAMVMLPTIDGKPMPGLLNEPAFTEAKDWGKAVFAKWYEQEEGEKIDVKKLNPNNKEDNGKAFKAYQQWVGMGQNVQAYASAYNNITKTGTAQQKIDAKKALQTAKTSAKMLVELQGMVKSAFGGRTMVLMPYAAATVVMNDDGYFSDFDIEDALEKHLPDVNISGGAYHEYMEDVVGKAPGYKKAGDSGNFRGDNYVSFVTYAPIRGVFGRNKTNNNARENLLMQNLEDKQLKFYNNTSMTSDVNIQKTAAFALW